MPAEPRPPDPAELLRAQDRAFDAAFSSGVIDELDALLAPDFMYTHTGGRTQPRAEFLAEVAARQTRSSRRVSDIAVELHASLAITRGNLTISYPTGRPDHYLRYVRVHRFEAGAWRLISHHTFEAADRDR